MLRFLRNLACLNIGLSVIAVQAQTIHLPKAKHEVVVIAHRGNHVAVPENTVAAYEEAIKCGADYVEVDLRTTKDGHLVVMHDATVDRTTNGNGKVADMSFTDIQKLQVFNNNKRIHHVPDFEQVLKICKGKINIYLDFKDASVAETWKQIVAAGMEKQVVVYLNKEQQYEQWKNVSPQIPLMTSLPEEVKTEEQLADFLKSKHVQIFDNVKNTEMLGYLKQRKIQVWLDVQSITEGPSSWDKFVKTGVNGLQTDHPTHLVSHLKKLGVH